jgi:hypothetical protein
MIVGGWNTTEMGATTTHCFTCRARKELSVRQLSKRIQAGRVQEVIGLRGDIILYQCRRQATN